MVIPETELSHAPWRKSTRSGSGDNCVEVVTIDTDADE